MRKWAIRIAILAAIVAAAIIVKVVVFKPDPVPVLVVEVEQGRVEDTITNSRAGTVRAYRRAKLSPEIGGQVIDLPYREGDNVAAEEIVLRLDDGLQQARVELSRREVEAAGAERDRACLAAERTGRELVRVQKLAAEQIVSEDLLDEVESGKQAADAACAAARANVARASAALTVARTDLAKTVLKAPFSGVVAEISIEVGEWTTPSPPTVPVPPVIDLIDPSSIYISAPMDEVDSARVQAGQSARITVDSHRDRDFPAHVSRVAPYVLDFEQQNRTIEIEVELDDTDLATEILPGTSADVEVILQVRENVSRIPTTALMEGNRVLVLVDGLLAERDIEIGLRNWDFTEILNGLENGDSVVTSLDRLEVEAGAEAIAVDELPD